MNILLALRVFAEFAVIVLAVMYLWKERNIWK